jgi:hypothetical protein
LGFFHLLGIDDRERRWKLVGGFGDFNRVAEWYRKGIRPRRRKEIGLNLDDFIRHPPSLIPFRTDLAQEIETRHLPQSGYIQGPLDLRIKINPITHSRRKSKGISAVFKGFFRGRP